MFDDKKILFIGPHIDDIEFGCGGVISSISKKANIIYLTFSFSENSLLEGFKKEHIQKEMLDSCKFLGISNIINKNYKTRYFSESRQEILEDLNSIKNSLNPDIVFCPSSFDTHQDHSVIYNESFRCFKRTTIFGYEAPMNNRSFSPNFYKKLSKEDAQSKINAISFYESQLVKREGLLEFVRALSVVRGSQIGVGHAEAFEVIRMVL